MARVQGASRDPGGGAPTVVPFPAFFKCHKLGKATLTVRQHLSLPPGLGIAAVADIECVVKVSQADFSGPVTEGDVAVVFGDATFGDVFVEDGGMPHALTGPGESSSVGISMDIEAGTLTVSGTLPHSASSHPFELTGPFAVEHLGGSLDGCASWQADPTPIGDFEVVTMHTKDADGAVVEASASAGGLFCPTAGGEGVDSLHVDLRVEGTYLANEPGPILPDGPVILTFDYYALRLRAPVPGCPRCAVPGARAEAACLSRGTAA